MSDKPQDQAAQQGAAGQQQFNLVKIYTKDLSFETPNSPQVFQSNEWRPEVNVDLGTDAKRLDDQTFEVVIQVTVTAKQGENTAYLCEVHQAGIFQMRGFDDQTLHQVLGAFCPNILFPYAREVVSDLVTKGGFPQMLLGPVNFDALYQQRMAEEAKRAGAQPTADSSQPH